MNVIVLWEKMLCHAQSDEKNITLCGKRISTTDYYYLDINTLQKHGNKVCKTCLKKLKGKE